MSDVFSVSGKADKKQNNNAASTDQYPDMMDYDAVQEFARKQSPDVQKAIAIVMNSTLPSEDAAESTDPREQAIRDRNKISAYDGNAVFRLADKVAGDMEIEARRQQRAYAEKASLSDPDTYIATTKMLLTTGGRDQQLEVLRKLTPEQREEALRLAPGIAQQLGDDRGGAVMRTIDAFSRSAARLPVALKEATGFGGTREEIDYLHKLNLASQEFAPARPDDPWYSRGALQAAEMAPDMVMAAQGGVLGGMIGKAGSAALGRAAAAGVPGAKAAVKAAGAIGKVPTAVGLKAITAEGAGTAAGVTASMWAPQYAQEVDSLKELGMKDGFALRALAGATAAAVGLLESIVPNPWKGGDVSFKQGVIKAVRQHLWNTAKNLPGEVTEEAAQGIASGVGEHVAQYFDKDAKKKSIGEAFSKGWQQASDSVLPLVFMLGAPGVAGATGAAIRARRAQLEQLRSKGFVSKGDAKEVGIEGGTRKEIAAKVDAEIEDLKSRELIASVNESGTAAESANAIPEQAGVPSGSQQGDISAPPPLPPQPQGEVPPPVPPQQQGASAPPPLPQPQEQAPPPLPSQQQEQVPPPLPPQQQAAPPVPGAAEAVSPKESAPAASVAEEKPADAIGERTKVMDTSVIRAKSVTDEDNIRYELFESEDGKSGIIRQMDMDAGQVVSMTRYPSIDKAQKEFGRYEKIASPSPVSQEQATAKPSVSAEIPSPEMVAEPSAPVAEKAAPDQQAPVSPPSKFASWTVQQGSDGKLYRVDPKAKTKYEKAKTRQPVDPAEVVVATQDQFGNPINKELVAVRQDFANNAKPGAEFTWAPYAPAKFKVTKNGDILDVTTSRPMGTVQSTANSPALKKGSIKWTSLPSPAAQEAAQPKPDITQMPPSQPVQVSKPSPETQKSQPEPQEPAVPVPAAKPIPQEVVSPPRVAELPKSQALPPAPSEVAVPEEPVSRKKVVDHFTKIQQDQGAGEYVKSSVDKTYGRIWEKVRKSPWKTVNDLSVKGRDGKPRSRMVRDSVTKMKEAGFLTVAWDKDGNPHYAVPGAELPAWLTQSRNDSDLAKLPPKTAQTPPSAVAERVAEKAKPEPSQAESSKVISEKPKSSSKQMTPRSYLESKTDRQLKTLAKDLGVKADSREGVIESLLQNPDVVDSLNIALQKAKPSKPRKKKPAPAKDAAKGKEPIPVGMRSSDGTTRELLPSELTAAEKKQKSILEKMGVTLRLIEGGNFKTPGTFNSRSMTVWLDRSYMQEWDSLWEEQNRPPESMTWGLFLHEMLHAIKKIDSEAWNGLRDWINANPNEKKLLNKATNDYVQDYLNSLKTRLLEDAKRSGKKASIKGKLSTAAHVRSAMKAAVDAGIAISEGTERAAKYSIDVLSNDDLRNEEGLSRYLEDKAGDFDFWDDLGNDNPSLLAKIGRWLLRALRLADSNTLAGQTRAAIEKAMRRNNLATGEDSGIRAAAGKGDFSVGDINVDEVRAKDRKGNRVSKGLAVKSVKGTKVYEETDDLSFDYVKKNAPDVFIKNANTIADYPLVRGKKVFEKASTVEQAQEIYDVFVREVADNLNYLYSEYDPEFRMPSTLWYDGANAIANRLADDYNVSPEQVAGIIAAMSPQKDWYQNVRLAELLLEAFRVNPVMTPEMIAHQRDVVRVDGLKEYSRKVRRAEMALAKANLEHKGTTLENYRKIESVLSSGAFLQEGGLTSSELQKLSSQAGIGFAKATGQLKSKMSQDEKASLQKIANWAITIFKEGAAASPGKSLSDSDLKKLVSEHRRKVKSAIDDSAAALVAAKAKLAESTTKADAVVSKLESHLGKTLDSVPEEIQSFMVRLYHEVNTTKDYNVIAPDGRAVGVAKNDNGENSRLAWGSYGEIGKGVSIRNNGSPKNITRRLGQQHKIRNFYNNIIDPMSEDGDVTMDTHAIAAALLMPLSGKSTQVNQNFGGSGAKNAGAFGIKGLYYAFAEAYNVSAKENGLLPRQMQSATWDPVRGLFTDVFKSVKKNVTKVNDIWESYADGKISVEEAREQVFEAAGGIDTPTWARPAREDVGGSVRKKRDRGRVRGDGQASVGATDGGRRYSPGRNGRDATVAVRGSLGVDERVWSRSTDSRKVGGYDLTARYVADVAEWAEAGVSAPAFIELKSSDKSARQFSEAITSARESQGKLGASVYVYPDQDYRDMRLFLTEDGKAGFALKATDDPSITDIVSVFNTAGSPHRGVSYAMIRLAVEEGGNTLDAFDTFLPVVYSANGFRAISRIKWDDDFAMEGWDKKAYSDFNNGEPDIVFMAYDPQQTEIYRVDSKEGDVFDTYDEAVASQRSVAKKNYLELQERKKQNAKAKRSGRRYSPGRRPESTGDGRGRKGIGKTEALAGSPSVPGINGPDPEVVAVAERYAKKYGIDLKRQAEYVQVDEDRARRIADAYAQMPHDPQNPKVKEAYQELIKQTTDQYRALEDAGYKFWFMDLGIPSNLEYASSPYNALRDLRSNKQMGVFPTTDGFGTSDLDVNDNPLLADTGILWPSGGLDGEMKPVLANDLFRAVHDAFGHSLEGAGFRARGEENAWQAHVRLFYGAAVGAITSETRGQNSWLNYGPHGEANRNAKVEDTIFADQKTGLMPEWTWTEGRAADMEDVGDADMNGPDLESGLQYAVARPQLAKKLNSGKKVKLYRAMLLIDGKLYPPMSSRSKSDEGRLAMRPGEPIGQWMQSEERPELVPKTGKNAGKFPLQKPKGVTWAAYAPYFHASPMPLNDQFTASWLNDGIRRPRMVIVEVEVPASEMTSGYQAEGSSKKVGSNKWRAGVVASKLPGGREVVLSRYLRIKRIVPDAEVAKKIADIVNPARLSIPENVITPQLRAELEKNGVRISPKGTKGEAIRYSPGRQRKLNSASIKMKAFGVEFETGKPVTFAYVRSTESATNMFGLPKKGDRFRRDVEPSGEYMVFIGLEPRDAEDLQPNQISGIKTFNNPLVIATEEYGSDKNWKPVLSSIYGGKTGKKLSQAVVDDGYDGIVTASEQGGLGEIVDLTTFDYSRARYSPGRRVDEKYLAAVKDGDKKLAQRMVNKAAQKAGEFAGGVSPVVYHGSPHAAFYKFQIPSKGFNSTVFGSYEVSRNAAFFTPDKTAASNYQTQGGRTSGSTRKFRIFGEMLDWRNGISDAQFNTLVDNGVNSRWLGQKGASWELFDKEQDPDGTLVKAIKKMGYEGVIIRDTDGENDFDAYVAFSPSQIKSSDPVTYDDAGNVIPLSKRFDDLQSDVRYSPGRKKDAILAALYKQLEEKGAIKPKAAGDRTTSIKNRKTDELRAESGFPPRVRPSSESFEEWEDRARQQYPTAKDRLKLIAEAERYPERMGKIESAAIGQHITYLDNQRIAGKDVADELRRTIKVANIVGTEAGRALVSRRAERYGDFSLAGLISEHMRVAGTDPTDSQIQDYAELADRIKQLETDKIELAEKLAKETIARIKAEAKAKPATEPQKPKQGTKRAALLKKVADSFAAFQNAWGQERSSVGRTPALETIADFGFGTETLPDPATVSRSEWLRAYMPLVMQGVPDADISEKDMNVLASAFGDDNPFAPNSKLMKMLGKWAIQSDLHEANWGGGVRVLFEDKSPATRMMLEQISKESGVSANRDDFYDPADYKSLAKAFVKYLPKHLAKKPEGYSYGYSDTKRLLETSKALLDPLEYAINVWESSQQAEVADADIRYSPGRQGDAAQAAAANLVKLLREMGVSSTLEFELQIKANLKDASPEQMQALMDAWNASSEKTDVISPLGDDPDNADIGARAKELMRLAIEAGYGATPETWMEVVDVVHEQLSLDVPGIDKYDTMQAMSDYGVWRKLSGEEVAVKTRAIRGKARQSLKIEDTLKAIAQSEAWLKDGVSPEEVARRLREKNLLPKATGREQATPDSIERELIAEFNKLKKTLPVPAESREGQLKSALSTAKTSAKNRLEMLDNDISALEDAVKNRKELVKPVAEKTRLEPDAELEDLRSQLDAKRRQRDELKAEYNKIFPSAKAKQGRKPLTDEQRLEASMKLLARQIDAVKADIQALSSGSWAPAAKNAELTSARKEQLKSDLASLRETQKRARKASPLYQALQETKYWERYRKTQEKRLAFWENRRDEAKAGRLPVPLQKRTIVEKDILDKNLEIEEAKYEAMIAIEKATRANWNAGQWIGQGLLEATSLIPKTLMLGLEMSFVLRQGFFYTYSQPMKAFRALTEAMPAVFSQRLALASMESIENRPNADEYLDAKVDFTKATGPQAKLEELYQSAVIQWLERTETKLLLPLRAWAKVYQMFERGNRTFSNIMKADMYDIQKRDTLAAREFFGLSTEWTKNDIKETGRITNIFSGRGTGIKGGSPWLDWLFLARRWTWSRIQADFIVPFQLVTPEWIGQWNADRGMRVALAKLYIQSLVGHAAKMAAAYFAYSVLAGDDEEKKPTMEFDLRSSDALALKVGETRFKDEGGMMPAIVLAARIATGTIKTGKGEIKSIYGEDVQHGGKTAADFLINYGRYKLGTAPSAILEWISGRDAVGTVIADKDDPTAIYRNIASSRLTPLTYREIYAAESELGLKRGTLAALEAFFGVSVSTHGDRTKYKKGSEADRKKQFDNDLKAMQWNSPDPAYSDLLSNEQMEAVSKRREAKRQGLIFAAGANPQRKDYKNAENYDKAVAERDKARQEMAESGITLPEARSLLIEYYKDNYGSAYELKGGSYVMKSSAVARLREIKRQFSGK